jgi:hypothetical protein
MHQVLPLIFDMQIQFYYYFFDLGLSRLAERRGIDDIGLYYQKWNRNQEGLQHPHWHCQGIQLTMHIIYGTAWYDSRHITVASPSYTDNKRKHHRKKEQTASLVVKAVLNGFTAIDTGASLSCFEFN